MRTFDCPLCKEQVNYVRFVEVKTSIAYYEYWCTYDQLRWKYKVGISNV